MGEKPTQLDESDERASTLNDLRHEHPMGSPEPPVPGGGAAMRPGDPIPDIDVTLKQNPGGGKGAP